MTDTSPLTRTVTARVANVAAGSDLESNIAIAPFAGTVAASYAPDTVLTGANTESRTLSIINKGQSGSGTTVPALKAFTSGVNAPADDETTITASVTAADLVVAAGDVIAWKSLHVGSTGLADPGGLAKVVFTRS